MNDVVITILHAEGCQGAPRALEEAEEAFARLGITGEIRLRLIADEAAAVAEGFRGSPTVLVDSHDVETEPRTPVGTLG